MFDAYKLEDVAVLDLEADGLDDATQIHVVAIREIVDGDTKKTVYRSPTSDPDVRRQLADHLGRIRCLAGHNILGYDLPTLYNLCGVEVVCPVLDTLVLSRLLNYKRPGGHSLEAWGERLGVTKTGTGITDWSVWTQEMESRCLSDIEINFKIVELYRKYWQSKDWQLSLRNEMFVAKMCKVMHDTGFPFDKERALELQGTLQQRIGVLDSAIEKDFGPKTVNLGEVRPRLTKNGTLNRSDFRWLGSDDLSAFDGGPFTRFEYAPFNPGSPRQVVERLNEFGWKPTEKTDGHIKALKDKSTSKERLAEYAKYGWKVSEENLSTIPESAPASARSLAERIVLASRLSDLVEWLAASRDEGDCSAVHGSFQSIGAWTHRVSHQNPNTANIPQAKPSSKDTPFQAEIQKLNGEMRKLFKAKKGYRLIGTDADGIQMRIFAHLCKDERLIHALVSGNKESKTDIHSLNQSLLGSVCGSRDVAKTFIYAFLLGAGAGKVAEILSCTFSEAKAAVEQFIEGLPGLKELKKTRIPMEVQQGFFLGLDGRKVLCDSQHLMMSGHLQNGEKVIMTMAMEDWFEKLTKQKIPFEIVNWVHDEWQTMIPDDDEICAEVQRIQMESFPTVGEKLGLLCPLKGTSAWGYNWKETH